MTYGTMPHSTPYTDPDYARTVQGLVDQRMAQEGISPAQRTAFMDSVHHDPHRAMAHIREVDAHNRRASWLRWTTALAALAIVTTIGLASWG